MTKYTHNLKIVLSNPFDKIIITDGYIIDQIYYKISNRIFTNKVTFMDQEINTFLCWNKEDIGKLNKLFMGELFTLSMHSDKLLYECTRVVLQDIENKLKETHPGDWRIVFHISKILE